jgi:hypothetical protein
MYFYQRLWLAIRFKNVYNRYVTEMFWETFCWWYFKGYEDRLVRLLDWQAGRHVSSLAEWIERTAKQSEMEEWEMQATGMEIQGRRSPEERAIPSRFEGASDQEFTNRSLRVFPSQGPGPGHPAVLA